MRSQSQTRSFFQFGVYTFGVKEHIDRSDRTAAVVGYRNPRDPQRNADIYKRDMVRRNLFSHDDIHGSRSCNVTDSHCYLAVRHYR